MKTPDITPAQIKAVIAAGVTFLAAIGLPISDSAQTELMVAGTAIPSILLLADAIIRYGRSRVFASADTIQAVEKPLPPA